MRYQLTAEDILHFPSVFQSMWREEESSASFTGDIPEYDRSMYTLSSVCSAFPDILIFIGHSLLRSFQA